MAQSHIEDLLTCPICLDRFQQPKQLPCQHTLCLKPCLEGLVQNQRVRCPECRFEHSLPHNGVKGFPTNLTMVQLLDVSDRPKPRVQVPCQDCKKNNIEVGCQHCDKILCHPCALKHTRILNEQLQQIVAQAKQHLPTLSQKISKINRFRSNAEEVQSSIKQWHDECSSSLEKKTRQMLDRVNDFAVEETGSYQPAPDEVKMRFKYDLIQSCCDSTERINQKLSGNPGNPSSIPEMQTEMVKLIKDCQEYASQGTRVIDIKIPTGKIIKFDIPGSCSIADSIRSFEGLSIAPEHCFGDADSMNQESASNARAKFSSGSGSAIARLPKPTTPASPFPTTVQNYRSKGEVKKCISKEGRGKGKKKKKHLGRVWGIGLTAEDNIMVTDIEGCKILIFNTSGGLICSFGSYGIGDGQFDGPSDVCASLSGRIVVADTGNDRVQIFDNQGKFILAFGPDCGCEVMLDGPCSVAVSSEDFIFVADYSTDIRIFDSSGGLSTLLERVCDPYWAKFVTVNYDDKLIVADNNKMKIYEPYSLTLAREIDGNGQENGKFHGLHGITSDCRGNVIVSDSDNHRIQIFDKNGKFISSFGKEGDEPGEMRTPIGVAILKNGDIVVSDSGNRRIQIF